MKLGNEATKRYVESMLLLSLLCLGLLIYRTITTGITRYWFIPGNLVLAWAGLAFGWLLCEQLKNRPWRSWQNISLSVLWLFFLPNTWYLLTDSLHVFPTGEVSELYDVALMACLTLTGFLLGFTSLYLVHKQLVRSLSPARSWLLVELVLFISSFGIYLGRVLRWNSWDIVSNPTGLIINVSDRFIDPLGNPHALDITGLFLVILTVSYIAFWRGLQVFDTSKTSH